MIACLTCGRPLIDGSPKEPHAAVEVRAAMQLHTCKTQGDITMTNPADQCSRCDTVADLIEQGITTLEDAASVAGCPTPSLHVHLVQHDRDDLLLGLTYGGKPIIEPKLEETTPEPVVLHAVEPVEVPDPDGPSCACDAYWFDDGETEFTDSDGILHTEVRCGPDVLEVTADAIVDALGWPEGTDPQEIVDAAPITVHGCGWSFGCGRGEDHEGQCISDEIIDAALEWLCEEEDDEVRSLARQIRRIFEDRQKQESDRALLADLVEQRDALNAEIEALAQRLGDLEQPEPEPVAEKPKPKPKDGGSETARIREWARSTGRKVNARGTLPRELVEAYREAHA